MTLFAVLFWLDAIALVVGVLLSLWGISALMPVLGGMLAVVALGGTAAALVAALRFRAAGRHRLALWILLVPAVPALAGLLAVGAVIVIVLTTGLGPHH